MNDANFLLDGPAASSAYWTTVNAGEALPGVLTPADWSWYHRPSELGLMGIFKALGVAPANMPIANDPDQRFIGVFFGRYVINVDTFRRMADMTPGNSGNAVELQFFGEVRPGVAEHKSIRRYGVVALKLPHALLTLRHRLTAVRERIGPWWQGRVEELPQASLERAVEILFEGHARFTEATVTHITCSGVTQMLFGIVVKIAQKLGLAGIETSLTTGYGLEETGVQELMWKISRNEGGSVADVIRHHGFTSRGMISQKSWRDDPALVQNFIERFRELADDKRPSLAAERQRNERLAAEARLMAAAPWYLRFLLRRLLKLTAAYMPTRESGRAAVLHGVDVGRAAVNRIGQLLAERGSIDSADDVMFFFFDELRAAASPAGLADARALVAARRERHRYYESIELPQAWSGRPEPQAVAAAAAASGEASSGVAGIAVTPHSVTGVARVISDPDDSDDFEPGEILVCATTDPSWASLFTIAGGVVIDIGGTLSHGAIVAREMGIPCVINTHDGTRRIPTGATVHIDGASGRVAIVASC